MLSPLPFALHANLGCPGYAELALSLAGEFHAVDPAEVEQDIAELVDRCAGDHGGRPLRELAALRGLLIEAGGLGRTRAAPAAHLHLDAALRRRAGDPAVLAVCLAEVGARSGFDVGIVGGAGALHIAHRAHDEPIVLDVAAARLRGADDLAGPLEWCCSHQVCSRLLLRLQRRLEREGDLGAAIHAAELRTSLPFDADSLTRAERELARLRARLN